MNKLSTQILDLIGKLITQLFTLKGRLPSLRSMDGILFIAQVIRVIKHVSFLDLEF